MSKLDDILTTNVTRKQFLATIGLGLTSILGLSTIIGIFTKSSPASKDNGEAGYGVRHYGH